jgi:hypothetical protein
MVISIFFVSSQVFKSSSFWYKEILALKRETALALNHFSNRTVSDSSVRYEITIFLTKL